MIDPLAGVANAQVQGIDNLTLLDNAGVQRCPVARDEDLNHLCTSYKLSLKDPKTEEKFFPHLYPYDRGGVDITFHGTDSISMVKSLMASM